MVSVSLSKREAPGLNFKSVQQSCKNVFHQKKYIIIFNMFSMSGRKYGSVKIQISLAILTVRFVVLEYTVHEFKGCYIFFSQ